MTSATQPKGLSPVVRGGFSIFMLILGGMLLPAFSAALMKGGSPSLILIATLVNLTASAVLFRLAYGCSSKVIKILIYLLFAVQVYWSIHWTVYSSSWLRTSKSCGNQMLSITTASLLFAGENNGTLPSTFAELAKQGVDHRFYICPALKRNAGPSTPSYEIVNPGLKVGDTNKVFLRCKVHGHLARADGTVWVNRKKHTKTIF